MAGKGKPYDGNGKGHKAPAMGQAHAAQLAVAGEMMSRDELRDEVMIILRLAQLPAERLREQQIKNQQWASQGWNSWQGWNGWTWDSRSDTSTADDMWDWHDWNEHEDQ